LDVISANPDGKKPKRNIERPDGKEVVVSRGGIEPIQLPAIAAKRPHRANARSLKPKPGLKPEARSMWLATKRLREDGTPIFWLRAGAVAGIVALATQNMVEMTLRVPANMVLFVILVAISVHRPASPHAPHARESSVPSADPFGRNLSLSRHGRATSERLSGDTE
jgi:hypothetical protein